MDKTILDATMQIRQSVEETEEEFIFSTIKPYCEGIAQRNVSKQELVDALTTYRKFKWIPVEERLPELKKTFGEDFEDYVSDYVLVTTSEAEITIARYWKEDEGEDGCVEYAYGWEDVVNGAEFEHICGDVLAWMPLPKPYKKEAY